MTDRSKNVAVGITVVVALAALAGMIMLFTGLPSLFQPGYTVHIRASGSHDAHEGDPLHAAGMRVGRITGIRLVDPEHPFEGVRISARIEDDIVLPSNVRAYFYNRGLTGSTYIELKPSGDPYLNPKTGEPFGSFPRNGSITMKSERAGQGLLPPEASEALKGISDLAKKLNTLFEPSPLPTTGPGAIATTGPETKPVMSQGLAAGLKTSVAKLNRSLDAINAIFGDPENQRNLKRTLARMDEATASAAEAMDLLSQFARQARKTLSAADETIESFDTLANVSRQRVDTLMVKLIEDAEQISRLMQSLNRAVTKIESGEGTAGKLLNDPDLYNQLVQVSRQLNTVLTDAKQLIDSWRKGGVPIKVE
jgi:phospholipid/cholesterol/gamma-HCH transport system substrate-binding protein